MINASKDKLQSFYQGNIRYQVPFFQRSYVWDEENWQALWDSVNQVYLDAKVGKKSEHFIGTIITKQIPAETLGQNNYDLIDGQQRLTTVSLFLKGLADCCKGDLPYLKTKIDSCLVFQNTRGEKFTRVRLCRNDQPYFDALVSGVGTDVLHNQENPILKAYQFFKEKAQPLMDEEIDVLTSVILERVPVISMLLSSDDDEQVIFDTINSLGVKLTTAELLKNYIFKERELDAIYDGLWVPTFEANEGLVQFWNKEKTSGRVIRTNIEVLLYCYLIIKTRHDVRLDHLYSDYKKWLTDKTLAERKLLLQDLKEYANIYAEFPEGEELNEIAYEETEKRFFHLIENLSITTAYPLILYVYKEVSDIAARKNILERLESYLVRRNICRLTTKNYNNLFISMIQKLAEAKESSKAITVEVFKELFAGFDEDTNKFPSDADFKLSFKESHLSNQNAREILFCIALYEKNSDFADVKKLSSSSYSVEHMMPIKWQEHWMKPGIDENGKAIRNKAIRTLGNLTLITKRLISKLSNAPWPDKKGTLKKYSSLAITVDYLGEIDWAEESIDSRANRLLEKAVKMWRNYS